MSQSIPPRRRRDQAAAAAAAEEEGEYEQVEDDEEEEEEDEEEEEGQDNRVSSTDTQHAQADSVCPCVWLPSVLSLMRLVRASVTLWNLSYGRRISSRLKW
jgi:hypothetical protein